MDGVSATKVVEAVARVLPIDAYVECPVNTMQVVGDRDAVPKVVERFRAILSGEHPDGLKFGTLERHEFYARARQAFAIVATGERRLYGNILLTKGVVERAG